MLLPGTLYRAVNRLLRAGWIAERTDAIEVTDDARRRIYHLTAEGRRSTAAEAERLGLAPRERELVALVSRYHRRSGPRRRHPEFAALPAADQGVVRRLSALLRVADGLDRGHSAAVESVVVELAPEALRLRIAPREPGADLGLECWGGSRKADVLSRVLERDIEIIAP